MGRVGGGIPDDMQSDGSYMVKGAGGAIPADMMSETSYIRKAPNDMESNASYMVKGGHDTSNNNVFDNESNGTYMMGANQSNGTYMAGAKQMGDSDDESEMVRKIDEVDDEDIVHKIGKMDSMVHGFDGAEQPRGSIYT